MKYLRKTAMLTVASLFIMVAQAQAYSYDFGGVNATQYFNGSWVNAGLTADTLGIDAATNTATQPGWFIETFDAPPNGGFTTLDPASLSTTGGGYDLALGSGSSSATPADDATYYFYTPGVGTSGSATVDNSDFIAYNPNLYIDYMGLYFGSIDTYNFLDFTLRDGTTYTITGTEILQHFSGTSGDQVSSASNVYVNIYFDPEDFFTSFTVRTNNVALEIDNVVTHVTATPEPSTFILLGAGLLGLVALGRKKFVR